MGLPLSISLSQAEGLERRFEVEEIHCGILEIDREKSPGPDGFTTAFFKNYWEVVKDDLLVFN